MRRIVAVFGALVAAVVMSIGGASVASADDITIQNSAIGLWPQVNFQGVSVEQVLPTGVCQTLQLATIGSISNTGNGIVSFFDATATNCMGALPVLVLAPGVDNANVTALPAIMTAIST